MSQENVQRKFNTTSLILIKIAAEPPGTSIAHYQTPKG